MCYIKTNQKTYQHLPWGLYFTKQIILKECYFNLFTQFGLLQLPPMETSFCQYHSKEAEITNYYAFPVSSENNLPTLQEWMHKAEEDLREKKAIPLL